MAGHGDTNGEPGAMDITSHRASYEGFIGYFKWGTIVAAMIAAIVVVIIA